MSSNFLESDVGAVLTGVFRDSSGVVYAVNPTRETVSELIFGLHDVETPPTVRLLAPGDPIKDVLADFVVAGRAADLIDAGTLALRVLEDAPEASLLVTESAVVSLVAGDDRVGGLSAGDGAFVGDVRGRYEREWADAEPYSLRTPPLSAVRETLAADIGVDTAEDFDALLDSLEVAKGEGEGLDEVAIALLVAARNGQLLYDMSKWGEDVGLASKATFSRMKTRLEDSDLVTTEKVPIDVGRPRLRLRLAEDLREVDLPELGQVAQERLYD
ncbi:transcriptional regulator TbsP [Halosimplex marinum]|uniref:transcriptional regulator TbsP n=1 Tax=Halosimplex marinum TaxID=3396620 RepID=UPI003F57FED5